MTHENNIRTLPKPDPKSWETPAKSIRIRRDGLKDYLLKGWVIGCGSHGDHRGVDVLIGVSEEGKLVTGVRRWSRYEGEVARCCAAAHTTAESAYEWLVQDGDGLLGRASKEAWLDACQQWDELNGADVEVV